MTGDESDTEMMDKAVCPHCGHAHDPADVDHVFFTEDPVEFECEECEKEFTCVGSVSWTFTTQKGHTETAHREKRKREARDAARERIVPWDEYRAMSPEQKDQLKNPAQVNGRKQDWVGIGWIDLGPSDGTEPTLIGSEDDEHQEPRK